MKERKEHKEQIESRGYAIIEDVYSSEEIDKLIDLLNQVDSASPTFRKSRDLFAIRQFLKEVPEILPLVFSDTLKKLIRELFGPNYFITKSIYFDKPEESNWFVAYHQDLTISVNKKLEMEGFDFWTVKQSQFAVQPPLDILRNNFTLRIHLDDTDEKNGALKVVPSSHNKGVYRPETIDWEIESEVSCATKRGGAMIMKPLLLHASDRTTNNQRRRVIHIEFSNQELPNGLRWSEQLLFDQNIS